MSYYESKFNFSNIFYEDEDDEYDDDYEMDDKSVYDAEDRELEKELEEAEEERNGDYSDVWYDKEEVKKENTVKLFQSIQEITLIFRKTMLLLQNYSILVDFLSSY